MAVSSLLSLLPLHGVKGKPHIPSDGSLYCPKRVCKRLLWPHPSLSRLPMIRSQVLETSHMNLGYPMIESEVDRRPALHNPLIRHERLGPGWLAAVFEWEGVLVEDNPELDREAWLALAREEGKPPPPAFVLHRIQGMKAEQAVSEVLCWSRDSLETKRISARKEEIYQALHQSGPHGFRPGSREFLAVLTQHKIPMALVSTRPRKAVESAIFSSGIEKDRIFDVIVTSEDVYRGKPDPEMFTYAAQLLQISPRRCIVFGNSNLTVEAARDAQMSCVAVAGRGPLYELGAADLVVRRLDELSVVDLKSLTAAADEVEEVEVVAEEEDDRSLAVGVADFW